MRLLNTIGHLKGRIAKILVVAAGAFLLVVGLAGCRGPDGAVFITFTHDIGLYAFVYDDTNIPSLVSTYTVYETAPGSYYIEWTYDDGSPPYYFAYYSITAEEGGLFWTGGEDTFFEFYMGRGFYDFFTSSGAEPQQIQGARLSTDNRFPIDTALAELVQKYTKESGPYTLSVSVYEQRADD